MGAGERTAGSNVGDSLEEVIRTGIQQMGKTLDEVTCDDFAPVDALHVGGREATAHLVAPLGLSTGDRVFEVGCGLGGSARFVVERYSCRVTGIDPNDEYIRVGAAINRWVGLADRIDLRRGNALALPFEPAMFDAGYMICVGMNIADKSRLFAEIARVLRKQALFAVYDIMRVGEGEIAYPVPWADMETTGSLGTIQEYEDALHRTGFGVVRINDRRDSALDFFEAAYDILEGSEPPFLGMNLVMGANAGIEVKNVLENLVAGVIAPVEIIALSRKPI